MGVDFLKGYPNNELFGFFRQGPGANEFLRQAFALAQPDFESRRVADLTLEISASKTAANIYTLAITNRGEKAFRDLHVHYERILLSAECFGLDTTHMPSDLAWKSGEPILLECLRAGETCRLEREGYDSFDRFDGRREDVVDIEFRAGDCVSTREDRRWCQVTVDLPNARNR